MSDIEKKTTTPTTKGSNESTSKVDKLEALYRRLDMLEDQNKLLLKVADKHKLQRATRREDLGQLIRIRLHEEQLKDGEYKDEVIVGWRMTANQVRPKDAFDDDKQKIEITTHTGKKVEMNYYDFAVTNDKKIEVPVLSTRTERVPTRFGKLEEKTFYTVEFEGDKLEIEATYIN